MGGEGVDQWPLQVRFVPSPDLRLAQEFLAPVRSSVYGTIVSVTDGDVVGSYENSIDSCVLNLEHYLWKKLELMTR